MINALLDGLFGCSHRKTSFPLTSGRNLESTYVVCLDCGKEFHYDWEGMRMGAAITAARPMAAAPEPALHAPGLARRFFA